MGVARTESTFGFDGIKTVLYLFVLSHVVTQNRMPLLRNMLYDSEVRAKVSSKA
jgi:hypothetical protein